MKESRYAWKIGEFFENFAVFYPVAGVYTDSCKNRYGPVCSAGDVFRHLTINCGN